MKARGAFNHHLFPGGGKSKPCEVESARAQDGEKDEV